MARPGAAKEWLVPLCRPLLRVLALELWPEARGRPGIRSVLPFVALTLCVLVAAARAPAAHAPAPPAPPPAPSDPPRPPPMLARCAGVPELEAGWSLAQGLAGGASTAVSAGAPSPATTASPPALRSLQHRLAGSASRLTVSAGPLWASPPPPTRVRVTTSAGATAELERARDARAGPAPGFARGAPLARARDAADRLGFALTIASARVRELPWAYPGPRPPLWEHALDLSGRATLDQLRRFLAELASGAPVFHVEELDVQLGSGARDFTCRCALISSGEL